MLNPSVCVSGLCSWDHPSHQWKQILLRNSRGNTEQLVWNAWSGFQGQWAAYSANPAGESISLTSCTKEFIWFLFLTFSVVQLVLRMGDLLTCLRTFCLSLKLNYQSLDKRYFSSFLISILSPRQNFWVDIEQTSRLELHKNDIIHLPRRKKYEVCLGSNCPNFETKTS